MRSGRSSGLACRTFTGRSPLFPLLDHLGGNPHGNSVRRYIPLHDRLRTDHGAFPHARAPQDRRFLPDPAVGADPNGRGDDPLILDPGGPVLVAMVEVGDVDPVGEDAVLTDLDVQVRVHGIAAAEDDAVPDPHVCLVAADARPGADPPASPELRARAPATALR